MVISFACTKNPTDHSCRVMKSDENLHLLNARMPCFECDGHLEIQPGHDGPTMTVAELFRACYGRGFDQETLCSPKHLSSLLVGNEVIEVVLEESPADKNRSLIESLVIEKKENGERFRLHFSTSTHGATIYKVTDDG